LRILPLINHNKQSVQHLSPPDPDDSPPGPPTDLPRRPPATRPCRHPSESGAGGPSSCIPFPGLVSQGFRSFNAWQNPPDFSQVKTTAAEDGEDVRQHPSSHADAGASRHEALARNAPAAGLLKPHPAASLTRTCILPHPFGKLRRTLAFLPTSPFITGLPPSGSRHPPPSSIILHILQHPLTSSDIRPYPGISRRILKKLTPASIPSIPHSGERMSPDARMIKTTFGRLPSTIGLSVSPWSPANP
jgi:hypothetical protein